jgi:hypothetical protein
MPATLRHGRFAARAALRAERMCSETENTFRARSVRGPDLYWFRGAIDAEAGRYDCRKG